MARIAFVADVHVGNHRLHGGPSVSGINTRCRLVLDSLAYAVSAAAAAGCDAFVVCGDLFDTVRPEPQVIRAVQDVLRCDTNMQVYLLCGNHDAASSAEGDNALAPLESHNVHVVDTPSVAKCDDVSLLLVPYNSQHPSEWLAQTVSGLAGLASGNKVAAVHLGVIDGSTPPFMRSVNDAVELTDLVRIAASCSVDRVYAGNWHSYRTWRVNSVTVVQCGALAPTGHDNDWRECGKMSLYDTAPPTPGARRSAVLNVPGPRFVQARTVDDLRAEVAAAQAPGCAVYARVIVDGQNDAAKVALSTGQVAGVTGWDARSCTKAAAAASARSRVAAAASATVQEAVANYVDSVRLEDVDKAALKALVAAYVAKVL